MNQYYYFFTRKKKNSLSMLNADNYHFFTPNIFAVMSIKREPALHVMLDKSSLIYSIMFTLHDPN